MKRFSVYSWDRKKTKANIITANKINYVPKISIIIPVYNVENYLTECLNSVINQSFKDIEIICIDDCSTDNSLNILKEFAQKDERIIVVTQKNHGAAVARNAGLKLASGEYLLIIDSDDMLEAQALEKLYSKAKSNDLDICIFNCYYYDNKTKKKEIRGWTINEQQVPAKQVFSYEDYAKTMYTCSPNWAWNKLFKKSFIDEHKLLFQETRHTNDTLFTCLALSFAERICIYNERLLLYRVNQKGTLTSNGIRNKYPLDILKVLLAIKKELIKNNKYELLQYTYRNLVIEQLNFNLNKTTASANFVLHFAIKYLYCKHLDIFELQQNDFIAKHIWDSYQRIINTNFFKIYSQNIFSIKNNNKKTHKIITILGVKIKIKRRNR